MVVAAVLPNEEHQAVAPQLSTCFVVRAVRPTRLVAHRRRLVQADRATVRVDEHDVEQAIEVEVAGAYCGCNDGVPKRDGRHGDVCERSASDESRHAVRCAHRVRDAQLSPLRIQHGDVGRAVRVEFDEHGVRVVSARVTHDGW